MSAKPPSTPSATDVIWLCRRLASALQAGDSVLSALDSLAADGPSTLVRSVRSIQQRVRAWGRVSEALVQLGWPSFVSGMARNGENAALAADALTLVADRLDAEQAWGGPKDRGLHAYALALGRLGVMLSVGVPILTALETAAAAAPRSRAHDVLMAARDPVRQGADLADALESLAPDLPEMTIDMIRDADRERRLGEALPVVADYLADAAGEKTPRRRKQEV